MTLQIPFMPMESTEMDWGDREFSPRNCDWETYKALETHPIQRHEDLRIEDKTFKDKMSTPSPNHKVIWSSQTTFLCNHTFNFIYGCGHEALNFFLESLYT